MKFYIKDPGGLKRISDPGGTVGSPLVFDPGPGGGYTTGPYDPGVGGGFTKDTGTGI
ncbi:hypothetical protein [Bacillus cereus]|uniref:hypothetical protein n=1 Tax=Bacillus cereus TaxID=1396 RepID=UPI00397D6789